MGLHGQMRIAPQTYVHLYPMIGTSHVPQAATKVGILTQSEYCSDSDSKATA